MQYLLKNTNFNFATSAAKADAYSPFAQVFLDFYISILMILKIKGVDYSQIVDVFLAVKLNILW